MKILFFTMTLNKGGAERVISTLCNNWSNRDDELFILTCIDSENGYLLNDNIHIKSLLSSEIYWNSGKIITFPRLCKRYRESIGLIKPDVVISFLPEPCYIAVLMNFGFKVPVIGSERSNPYYQYSNFILKIATNILYAKMKGFVFQTKGAQNFFLKKIQKKSVIIGNPLNRSFLNNENRKPNRKEIVSVGRITEEKNYSMLIDAFEEVHELVPEATLKIYGRLNESIRLDKIITHKGLESNIRLMGECNNVCDEIKNAGIFVLSSISEGMPNALMEAMALGLPVIATDCPSGGPRQLIKNMVNGILVENNNSHEMAAAIVRLINDEHLADV